MKSLEDIQQSFQMLVQEIVEVFPVYGINMKLGALETGSISPS